MPPQGFWVLLVGFVFISVLPVDIPLHPTYTHRSGVVLQPVRFQEPFYTVLSILCLDESIGTEFWNKTTAGEQIKIEPKLLKMCYSIGRRLKLKCLRDQADDRKEGSQP